MLSLVDFITIDGVPYVKCFSAAQAVKVFEDKTGEKFSSVALGKLLASAKVKPEAKNKFKENVYSGTKSWEFAWSIMVNHVCNKAIYDENIKFKDRAMKAPDCPLNEKDFILI